MLQRIGVFLLLASGCVSQLHEGNPCSATSGDDRATVDDPGTLGFSAAEVADAVDGMTWDLTFSPGGRVDDPTPFVSTVALQAEVTSPGFEFEVVYSSFPGCKPGIHLHVPIDLAITTESGTFEGQLADIETPWIDATSIEPEGLVLTGAVYPDANPFFDASGGTCWPGNAAISDISFGAGSADLAHPAFTLEGTDPPGVVCAGVYWSSGIAEETP